MNEESHNILTVDELENYVGKPIVCYYYNDYIEEFRDHYIQRPNLPRENIRYMWMFKLTEIPEQLMADNTIRGKTLYGVDTVVLRDAGDCSGQGVDTPHYAGIDRGIYLTSGKKGECSSAQSYVRTPTKEEMKAYMNVFRHMRIFGY